MITEQFDNALEAFEEIVKQIPKTRMRNIFGAVNCVALILEEAKREVAQKEKDSKAEQEVGS